MTNTSTETAGIEVFLDRVRADARDNTQSAIRRILVFTEPHHIVIAVGTARSCDNHVTRWYEVAFDE